MHNLSGNCPYSIKKMRSVEDEQEKEVKAYLEGKLSQAEKLKYEIADEMGVLDKVIKGGWKKPFCKRNRTDRWSYDKKEET